MDVYSQLKNNPIDTNVPLKRTRAKRSCDFCRKRKARCDADHSMPCSNCKAWGFTCEFLTVRKKRGPPSVYVENLELRCKKMELLLSSLTNRSIKDLEQDDFRVDSLNDQCYNSYDESNVENDDDDSANSTDEYEDMSENQKDDLSDTFSTMEETLANLKLEDYDSIKYIGSSAGLQLIDQSLFKSKPYVHLPGRKDVVLKLMAENELMVVRSDRSVSGKKSDTRLDVGFSLCSTIFDESKVKTESPTWEYTPSSLPNAKNSLPSNALIEKALNLYFRHIHTFLPIINRPRFETSDKKSSNILVQAVLAVAFRFASHHFSKLFKKSSAYAEYYFSKVMKRLRDSYRPRLRHVQAALLITLYLDMDESDVESMQWYTLGKAIRMAQDLGLHRSCSSWSLPPSEIETRHRVFYSLYIFDRLMSARAGKPLTILDRDFDTDLPVPYEVLDKTGPKGPPIYRSFICLIQLSEILGRILKALYAPKSKHSNSNAGLDDPTILAVFDRRLKNWKASLDNLIISQAQKVNLLLFYYTTMLLLHRPFIEFSPNENQPGVTGGVSFDLDKLAEESRQACANAASKISIIVRQKQTLMSDPDSYSPLCMPMSFVYSMFQSSLIHLAIALKNRDSVKKLRALQRSIGLLKQHEHLTSAHRAHHILTSLVTINGIYLNNILQNNSDDDDTEMELSLCSSPLSPLPTNSDHQPSLSSSSVESLPYPTSSPVSRSEINANSESGTRSAQESEELMPKSNLYQRMINTSVVGGITSDLLQGGIEPSAISQPLADILPYGQVGSTNSAYIHTPSPVHTTIARPQSNSALLSNFPIEMDQQKPHGVYYSTGNTRNCPATEQTRFQSENNHFPVLPTRYDTHHPDSHLNYQLHQAPLPFSAYSNNSTHSTINPPPSGMMYMSNNTTLPPSSLNWNDWGVYLEQQNNSPDQPTHIQHHYAW
ncbi:hypothetical protein K501DRAFT_334674 [Backusella circina FSU 941]|nr:hypothetical protein K501DRAFT_334674 [Backusella circina FSU 941]